ncbi:MAG: hypothetical protein LBT25_06705, partial [Candidatus Symbiothrix sp.]|nr:hypothetical protein [Candidatus Symbiothrix sp.]
ERNTLFFAKIAEIYQAELNGKVIYFYFNCFTETGFGEFFQEDGERVITTWIDLYTNSKDWKLIYEYGAGSLLLDYLEINFN